MPSIQSTPARDQAGPPFSSKAKFELTERVVGSAGFSRSPAMRAFLLYITRHAIAERPERIKEQSIGSEVLGRRPNYDPADDNIVRVRAHELRQRLEKYFATDGIEEPVVITVPKGTYIPEFHLREAPPAAPLPGPPAILGMAPIGAPAIAVPDTSTIPVTEVQGTTPEAGKWLPKWLWVASLLFAVAATGLLTRSVVHRNDAFEHPTQTVAIHDFWGQFFVHPDEDLRVITADTGFALWQDLSGQDLNLGDYLSRKYLQTPGDKLREVAVRRATSPADLTISLRLAALTKDFGGHFNQQYARDIGAQAFQSGNVVVIGSHRSNPWIEVFEPQLNFVVDRDAGTGAPLFRNKAPRPHETATYTIPAMLDVNGAEQEEIDSYGVVALLRGCNGNDLVVLLEGLNMEATEAAGEVLTDPKRLGAVLQSIGHQPGTVVAPFEALIKLKSLPGGYANPEVIAYRRQSGAPCK